MNEVFTKGNLVRSLRQGTNILLLDDVVLVNLHMNSLLVFLSLFIFPYFLGTYTCFHSCDVVLVKHFHGPCLCIEKCGLFLPTPTK